MHTGDLGTHRRGGLLQHRRPGQGHGHPRRRERLSARGRGVPLPPSGRADRRRSSACPTSAMARSSAPGSCCATAASATAEEIRAFCRGQIAHYKIPRYVEFVEERADDRDRQGPEVPYARGHDRAPWPQGGQDRLNGRRIRHTWRWCGGVERPRIVADSAAARAPASLIPVGDCASVLPTTWSAIPGHPSAARFVVGGMLQFC